jgi:hypothetical protein
VKWPKIKPGCPRRRSSPAALARDKLLNTGSLHGQERPWIA